PREIFPRAVTLASTNQALAFATGPALAGLGIAERGIAMAYVTYGVLLCGSLVSLLFVRGGRDQGRRRAPSRQPIREGLGFVRRRPVVFGCMVLDMFAVIFGGATPLLPMYPQDFPHVRPRGS